MDEVKIVINEDKSKEFVYVVWPCRGFGKYKPEIDAANYPVGFGEIAFYLSPQFFIFGPATLDWWTLMGFKDRSTDSTLKRSPREGTSVNPYRLDFSFSNSFHIVRV